jgi:putative transposase
MSPLDFTPTTAHPELIPAIMTMEEALMDWKMLLACVTGSLEEELLLRNESLVTENRILRNQIEGRVQLTDAERQTLAEIGKKLGKQALEDVASIVKPDTILAWHRKLVAQKFDGSDLTLTVDRYI